MILDGLLIFLLHDNHNLQCFPTMVYCETIIAPDCLALKTTKKPRVALDRRPFYKMPKEKIFMENKLFNSLIIYLPT
jgi:hypothetical protein